MITFQIYVMNLVLFITDILVNYKDTDKTLVIDSGTV